MTDLFVTKDEALQMKTWQNIFAIMGLFSIFFSLSLIYHGTEECAVLFSVFFIVLARQKFWAIMVYSALVFVTISILPVFAVAGLAALFLLVSVRFQFIKKNWRPILVGFYLYGSVIAFSLYSVKFFYPLRFVYILLDQIGSLSVIMLINGIYFIVIVAILQILLRWLYKNGYTAKSALAIASTVPLLVISIILPFLV